MNEKTLAIITDSRGGMMFNSRRQVKDVEVIADMAARFGGGGIFIAPYSAKLLSEYENVTVSEAPARDVSDGALIFLEDPLLIDALDGVATLVIYRYGIPYPADRFFEYDLSSLGFKRISKDKFSTAIHQKIEREVYKKLLNN